MRVQQVHLVAVAVAVEIQRRRSAAIRLLLEELHHHEVLEQLPRERVPIRLPGAFDAQQVAQQADVGEVEFGRFHLPFAEVLEVGRQTEDDVGSLQDGQPVADGLAADSDIVRRRGVVHQLPRPTSKKPQKALEGRQVLEIDELPHISFDIGSEVVGQSDCRSLPLVVDARQEAMADIVRKGVEADAGDGEFADGKRIQGQQRRAPGQGLGNVFAQQQLTGSGAHELPVAFSRSTTTWMWLSSSGARWISWRTTLPRNCPRNALGSSCARCRTSGDSRLAVPVVRQLHRRQGGLAGLPRPENGHHGIIARQPYELVCDLSPNHGWQSKSTQYGKLKSCIA